MIAQAHTDVTKVSFTQKVSNSFLILCLLFLQPPGGAVITSSLPIAAGRLDSSSPSKSHLFLSYLICMSVSRQSGVCIC